MSIIQADPKIGGHYHSYAPGHGALAFVHVVNGNATNEPVPPGIAKILLPDSSWGLAMINGRLEGYRIMRRLDNDRLICQNDLYRYEMREKNGGAEYEFYFWEEGEWEILRNESRRASLRYFLTHESLLPPAACEAMNAAK